MTTSQVLDSSWWIPWPAGGAYAGFARARRSGSNSIRDQGPPHRPVTRRHVTHTTGPSGAATKPGRRRDQARPAPRPSPVGAATKPGRRRNQARRSRLGLLKLGVPLGDGGLAVRGLVLVDHAFAGVLV